MNEPRKIVLIEESGAGAGATDALQGALQALGADVRRLALAPPYDAVLDALADGWLPVVMQAPPASDPSH